MFIQCLQRLGYSKLEITLFYLILNEGKCDTIYIEATKTKLVQSSDVFLNFYCKEYLIQVEML